MEESGCSTISSASNNSNNEAGDLVKEQITDLTPKARLETVATDKAMSQVCATEHRTNIFAAQITNRKDGIIFERLGKVRTPSCDDVVATPDILISHQGVDDFDRSLCGDVEMETKEGEMVLIRDTERVLSEDR